MCWVMINDCEELGILVDRDDLGTLLQIFTKPVGDRYVQFHIILWSLVEQENDYTLIVW